MRWLLAGVASLTILGIGYLIFEARERAPKATATVTPNPLVEIELPGAFSAAAQSGKGLYDDNCVTCHGTNGVGQDGIAPPLVHKIYEPSHHGDESFQRAVAQGARSHHWRFGDMPPVEGLSRNDVTRVVTYIRELQRANGIY